MELQEINETISSSINSFNNPIAIKAEAQTNASDKSGNRAVMRMMQHNSFVQANLQS